MFRLNWLVLTFAMTTLLAVVACGGGGDGHDAASAEPAPAPPAAPPAMDSHDDMAGGGAHAVLKAQEGLGISGEVTFTPDAGGVHIAATLSGAAGAGEHGFHIHETGDCSAADFTSAGGHFNPSGAVHGGPDDAEHHAGDLGNISIAADGSGELHTVSSMLSLDPASPNSVLGKAVIVHEKADDLESQPTGDAGGRIACGVIEASHG